MTPKEKAQDLIEKHLSIYDIEPIAIDCALISVEFAIEFAGGDMNEQFDKILYLVEVKHELQEIYEQQ